MKRLCYGITAVLLTSAFVTQWAQDGAWMSRVWGIDWKIQFGAELAVALLATFAGARIRTKA
jgi:hypothetical protein